MRGLIIRSPWIEHILEGRKIWEIRGKATKLRGHIALIRGGSGLVVGLCDVVDSIGPLTDKQLVANQTKHRATLHAIRDFGDTTAYAWVLTNVMPLPSPVPYQHPSGAVIWVTLDQSAADAILEQTSGRTACDQA